MIDRKRRDRNQSEESEHRVRSVSCNAKGGRAKEEKSVRNQLELLNLVNAGALPRTVRTISIDCREVLLGTLGIRLQGLGALLPVRGANLAVFLLRR